MVNDYLEVGELMVERLKATLGASFRLIAGESSLASVSDTGDYAPAAFVIYGARTTAQRGEIRGGNTLIDQIWIVACIFPNYDPQPGRSGDETRREAGPALAKVIQALHGWRPGRGHQAMEFLQDDRYADETGQTIWALAFSSRFTYCPVDSLMVAA